MPNNQTRSGHVSVSNLPDDPDFPPVLSTQSDAPDKGDRGDFGELTEDGKEDVEYPRRPESSFVMKAPDTSNLRNIGEASYGSPPPMAETVHGPDDRVKIETTDTFPWRAHASLLITAKDNSRWIGTAWFVGPRTLITAGHCIYIKDSGVAGRDGWVKGVNVMPGRNGTELPYGSTTSTKFRSVTGWTRDGDENYDYGAILLTTDLGDRTGWFGYGAYTDATLNESVGNISGYPGDKPTGTQWYDSRQIARVNNRKVYYDIDTAGGQSGSAAYRVDEGKRYAFAIHAYGGATVNSGTRINSPVFDNIKSWKAQS